MEGAGARNAAFSGRFAPGRPRPGASSLSRAYGVAMATEQLGRGRGVALPDAVGPRLTGSLPHGTRYTELCTMALKHEHATYQPFMADRDAASAHAGTLSS